MDTLAATYFVLFVVGSGFSVVSWLLGARGRAHGKTHLLAHGKAHGRIGQGKAHGLLGHGKHALVHAPKGGAIAHPSLGARLFLPLADVTSMSALASVGGGVGYLARQLGVGALPSLLFAVPSGLGAAYAVGGLVAWLQRGTRYAASFSPHGTVGTLLVRIAAGGTGELSYTHDGARRSLPAVSADGKAIDAGTEVVVLDVKNGIARVAPSVEVFGEEDR
jgi:hypothetical protein